MCAVVDAVWSQQKKLYYNASYRSQNDDTSVQLLTSVLLMTNAYWYVLCDCKVAMVGSDDVTITSENVKILQIDFNAPSTRPIYWRTKSIRVPQQCILLSDVLNVLGVCHSSTVCLVLFLCL